MTDQLLTMIDSALEQFRSRDLVAAAEVVDFLLDLRLAAIDPTNDALQQLLESEATPTGSCQFRATSDLAETVPNRLRAAGTLPPRWPAPPVRLARVAPSGRHHDLSARPPRWRHPHAVLAVVEVVAVRTQREHRPLDAECGRVPDAAPRLARGTRRAAPAPPDQDAHRHLGGDRPPARGHHRRVGAPPRRGWRRPRPGRGADLHDRALDADVDGTGGHHPTTAHAVRRGHPDRAPDQRLRVAVRHRAGEDHVLEQDRVRHRPHVPRHERRSPPVGCR